MIFSLKKVKNTRKSNNGRHPVPSTNLSLVKTGDIPRTTGYPRTIRIKLDLCFCTIPTVGFYRKHGEINHDDPREATAYDIATSNLPSRLMLEQASNVDIIITTALIPGRKAPVLVTQEMLDVMKAWSIIVDIAATNGGNVAQTMPDKVITTTNGVTIVGYTDLPLRLASTSLSLFGTNVAKFILSVGPQTTKEKGVYQINLEDDAVQNMLVAYDSVRRYPNMITPFSPPPPKTSPKDAVLSVVLTDKEMRVEANEKQRAAFVKNAAVASIAACALLAFGYANDSGNGGVPLLATFALAGLAGYQVVWGVAPALHSP